MSLAGTIAAAAKRALGAYGAPALLSHTLPSAYDPTTGDMAGPVVITPVRALLDASSVQTLGFKFGQDLVQGGDMKATIATTEPSVGDTLDIGGTIYTIKAVRPSFIQGTSVLWECLVTK